MFVFSDAKRSAQYFHFGNFESFELGKPSRAKELGQSDSDFLETLGLRLELPT